MILFYIILAVLSAALTLFILWPDKGDNNDAPSRGLRNIRGILACLAVAAFGIYLYIGNADMVETDYAARLKIQRDIFYAEGARELDSVINNQKSEHLD